MLIDRTQAKQDWRKEIPALQELSDIVGERFRPGDPTSLLDCQEALERVLASDWLARLVSGELDGLVQFPRRGTGGLSDARMTLFGGGGMALNLLVMTAPAGPVARLFASPRHSVLGVAGPGELEVQRFFQPEPFPTNVIDRRRRLEDRGVHRLRPGQSITVRAGYDVLSNSAPGGPTVVLVLETEESTPGFWRYDPSTLLPVAVVRAPGDGARLEFAASVMARLGDGRCTPALRKLFVHADHVVRWAAVRAAMQLDRAVGKELLAATLHDAHPHLRQAAGAALDRLRAAELPGHAAQRTVDG
jgi:hypothetical protein